MIFNCAKCGKEAQRPGQINRSKSGKLYCSRRCWFARNVDGFVSPRRDLKKYTCASCQKEFLRAKSEYQGKRSFCSRTCYHKFSKGENHASWKGGRGVHPNGYVYIRSDVNKRKKEHTLIAEKALGRSLQKNEVVHHINGDKTDNRNENLLICDKQYHTWLHHEMSRRYMQEHFGAAA